MKYERLAPASRAFGLYSPPAAGHGGNGGECERAEKVGGGAKRFGLRFHET
jgi:hypothetical protein